jgi:nicotinate-nucleotide pyrophosphorylase (carboxylating)
MTANKLSLPVEVETTDLSEVAEVLRLLDSDPGCCVTRIMLDNMAKYDTAQPGTCWRPQLMVATCGVGSGSTWHGLVFCLVEGAGMTDNHSAAGAVDISLLREAVQLIGDRQVETEASGNVSLQTVAAIAASGVTHISTGAITHSVTALDISLRMQTQPAAVREPGRVNVD